MELIIHSSLILHFYSQPPLSKNNNLRNSHFNSNKHLNNLISRITKLLNKENCLKKLNHGHGFIMINKFYYVQILLN